MKYSDCLRGRSLIFMKESFLQIGADLNTEIADDHHWFFKNLCLAPTKKCFSEALIIQTTIHHNHTLHMSTYFVQGTPQNRNRSCEDHSERRHIFHHSIPGRRHRRGRTCRSGSRPLWCPCSTGQSNMCHLPMGSARGWCKPWGCRHRIAPSASPSGRNGKSWSASESKPRNVATPFFGPQ